MLHRACIIGSIVIALGTTSVEAGLLAPSRPSQMVHLATGNPPCSGSGGSSWAPFTLQRNPDGTTIPFSIPADYVFVVIGIDWTVVGGTPGRVTTAVLRLGTSDGPDVWNDSAFVDGGGIAGSSAPGGGVVVKPGTSMCFGVTSGTPNFRSMHGFLAKDK